MTVSEQIIQVIDALCEKFGIAVNWTGENVIPYIELLCGKLIKYEIVSSIIGLLFSILLIVLYTIMIKKFAPKFKEGWKRDEESDEFGWQIGTVFACIVMAILYGIAIFDILIQVDDIAKCITFPELYVFEYISDLVKVNSN